LGCSAQETSRAAPTGTASRVGALRPVEASEADLEVLRAAGLSDHDAWDVIEVAAMYNFTNRLALATGQIPNPEYHALAR
jgi:alkylhydroperoxidase family enzyme